ncbi:tryptophan-rich sensory protein [Alkalihalobacterium elongatum]|uniref:tryptophan-rich sensory protein n=1 Tax=Alkalihalobacterium elongatum TaxID=2675466 RepID=UPI001C1F264F|nr:tryptophan-rich sensory protein [Alkalihalobacterium elongatum]
MLLTLILNWLAYLFMVLVNALANIIPIGGKTTGEISARLEVLFTPAGYVFSIWGLIYMLLGIWLVRQISKRRRKLPLYRETSPLFILSCLLNVTWIFLWHYQLFIWTVLVMISLLIMLILLYRKVKDNQPAKIDQAPFSIYLGWISVATIANISYVLVEYNWDGIGLSPITWTIIMLIVATLLAIHFRINENDRLFSLVFVWAIIGIGVQNQVSYPSLSKFAYMLAAIIFIVTLLPIKQKGK